MCLAIDACRSGVRVDASWVLLGSDGLKENAHHKLICLNTLSLLLELFGIRRCEGGVSLGIGYEVSKDSHLYQAFSFGAIKQLTNRDTETY